MDNSGTKIKFGFKKKTDNKPTMANIPVLYEEKEEEIEYIKIIENKKIKGSNKVTSFNQKSIPVTNKQNAKEPTFEDYLVTPVEEFGLAMLRGMGWNANDESVKPIEPLIRPKGAGLGHKFI